MNPRTLKALKESIAHWERLASGKRRRFESTGPEHCALCQLFVHKTLSCNGCPVMEKTGRYECHNTPYYSAREASVDFTLDSLEFKRAAAKELAFLRSLLPVRKDLNAKNVAI